MLISRIRLHRSVQGEVLRGSWRKVSPTDDLYASHMMIWKFFPETDAKRRFLYRVDPSETRKGAEFLVVSEEAPMMRIADEVDLWEVQSHEYEPKLRKGQFLEFKVRVHPTFSKRGERGRRDFVLTKRHDAKLGPPDSETRAAWYADHSQELMAGWLGRRGEQHGFRLAEEEAFYDDLDDTATATCALKVGRHETVYTRRRKKPGDETKAEPINISQMDLTGTLEVTDPDAFRAMLYHGLGHAKAFGCGLMLVKRTR